MKFCLSSRQENEYLVKADELKVQFRDRESLPDLFEKFPDKDIILMCYYGEEIDWKSIEKWNILSRGHFKMCLSSLKDAQECKKRKVPFYMGYPIRTYYELQALKDLGVCSVRLGEPLFFEMDTVAKFGIPVRVVPNIAYNDGYPRENGVCGTWIRPEDLDAYDSYVDVVEFEDADLRKEQALFRIYAEEKNWPGELHLIITNLHCDGLNRIITPTLVESRLKCGQRCQRLGSCKLCYRALMLANEKQLREYMEAKGLN